MSGLGRKRKDQSLEGDKKGTQSSLMSFFTKKSTPPKETGGVQGKEVGGIGTPKTLMEWDREWVEGTDGLQWEKGRKSVGGGGGIGAEWAQEAGQGGGSGGGSDGSGYGDGYKTEEENERQYCIVENEQVGRGEKGGSEGGEVGGGSEEAPTEEQQSLEERGEGGGGEGLAEPVDGPKTGAGARWCEGMGEVMDVEGGDKAGSEEQEAWEEGDGGEEEGMEVEDTGGEGDGAAGEGGPGLGFGDLGGGGRRDRWDNGHVLLPCSPKNIFKRNGQPRWEVIQTALSRPLHTFQDLKDCILEYSAENGKQWSFRALKNLIERFTDDERIKFFDKTLPGIVEMANLLPEVTPRPIPLLVEGCCRMVTLTQLQCASLLANGFLCTLPTKRRQLGEPVPGANFFSLYEAVGWSRPGQDRTSQNTEKLRCIVQYFEVLVDRRASGDPLTRRIEFHRRCLKPRSLEWAAGGGGGGGSQDGGLHWGSSRKRLGQVGVEFLTDAKIEDHDPTGRVWQADFANKYIGGGALSSGCVQEEIRFVLSPELIVSLLLCPVMQDNETILIVGSERFSNYTGYAASFKYAGPMQDPAECVGVDGGCLRTSVIAFDATHYGRGSEERQFGRMAIRRELNKALCAFLPPEAFVKPSSGRGGAFSVGRGAWGVRGSCVQEAAIATGNWGCGAFGGDKVMKAVIQMLAAAQAERPLLYMTFGEAELTTSLSSLFSLLVEARATVGQVYEHLINFKPNTSSQYNYSQQLAYYLEKRFE